MAKVSRKGFVRILGVTVLLLFLSYFVASFFAYRSESFIHAKNHLVNDPFIATYFDSPHDVEFRILDFSIFNRSKHSNAAYTLELSRFSKSIEVIVKLDKKTKWEISSIEYVQNQ